ncbi:MAG: YjbF family lipoprotein [Gammaproteobacteria bacterium]|nr:YjbF family lipoprotein [Gammaproteobacteria bacterium]
MSKKLLKLLLIGISVPLIHGCSSATWNAVAETWKLSGSRQANPRLTNDYVRNLPYASLLLKIEPNPNALVVLEKVNGKQQQWRATNGALVMIEGARVTGLQVESINYHLHPAHKAIDPVKEEKWQYHQPYQLLVDFPHLGAYSQLLNCQLTEGAEEAFTTPLRSGTAKVYYESCQLSDGRFKTTNTYWVDTQQMKTVKASQYFHPMLSGAIVFSEAKPLGWQAE